MTKARDNESVLNRFIFKLVWNCINHIIRVQKVVKAAKQSRKSTSDAIAKIHAKANELLLLIEEENEQSRYDKAMSFSSSPILQN